MLRDNGTAWAQWNIVDANIGRNARLNVIRHLLDQIPYEDLTPPPVELPERSPKGDYEPADDITLRIIADHYGQGNVTTED